MSSPDAARLSRPDHGPLISAVIIYYNAQTFLEEAIASVLAQTFQQWELLLVDDGSTDGSSAIAQGFQRRHPDRMVCLAHEQGVNRGMSASRNLGWRTARGQFIAFLDADDVWEPRKLERQIQLFHEHPDVGMVCGPARRWHSWRAGVLPDRDRMRSMGIPLDRAYAPPYLLQSLLRAEALTPATCSVLLRRRVLEEVGGYEDAFRGLFEDQVFFAKIYLRIPVWVSSEVLDRYRYHPDSCTFRAATRGAATPARARFLHWLGEYLRTEQVKDPGLWRALRLAQWALQNPRCGRLRLFLSRMRRTPLRTIARAVRHCIA